MISVNFSYLSGFAACNAKCKLNQFLSILPNLYVIRKKSLPFRLAGRKKRFSFYSLYTVANLRIFSLLNELQCPLQQFKMHTSNVQPGWGSAGLTACILRKNVERGIRKCCLSQEMQTQTSGFSNCDTYIT